MSSSIKLYGETDLPTNVCQQLNEIINDSFFKKLDKHFNKIKIKTKPKRKRKKGRKRK